MNSDNVCEGLHHQFYMCNDNEDVVLYPDIFNMALNIISMFGDYILAANVKIRENKGIMAFHCWTFNCCIVAPTELIVSEIDPTYQREEIKKTVSFSWINLFFGITKIVLLFAVKLPKELHSKLSFCLTKVLQI